ncbi:hypothetical protein H4R22_004949, partial [Coemansia sp. RSA 1290]
MSKLVAIIGATGPQGGSVLKTLYASENHKLRALTCNPDSSIKALVAKYPGIELDQADLDDAASLCKEFDNVDTVFGMTDYYALMQKEQQDKGAVDAAINAGVKMLVYSGMGSMTVLSGGKYTNCVHFDNKHNIEEYLNSKSDAIGGFTVEFTFPLKPTTKIPLVDTVNDVGPVVKYVLEHPEECLEEAIEVSGGYYEAQAMADAFTKATGKPARFVQIPYEAVGSDELAQMFKGIDEFGLFAGRKDFIERNKEIDYTFTTPT